MRKKKVSFRKTQRQHVGGLNSYEESSTDFHTPRSSSYATPTGSRPIKIITPAEDPIVRLRRYGSIVNHINRHNIDMACAKSTGVCMALGQYTTDIKNFFDKFTNFTKAVSINSIGQKSANGFVNAIEYEKKYGGKTYKVYTVLKSSRRAKADNLMYEYRVGQYINKLTTYYPCFLETYGLYKYNTTEDQFNMAMTPDLDILERLIPMTEMNYNEACEYSSTLAILIQHFDNFSPLNEKIKTDVEFVNNELLWVLFQLYIPLAHLAETFTHYDLHLKNTYVYEPEKGKYIQYHYHLIEGAEPISFMSRYMLKIIDYGRSYFKDDNGYDSKKIYDEVCKAKKCVKPIVSGNDCGSDYGFGWLEDRKYRYITAPGTNTMRKIPNWLISQKVNKSYDLQALDLVLDILILEGSEKREQTYSPVINKFIDNIADKSVKMIDQQEYRNANQISYKEIIDAYNPTQGSKSTKPIINKSKFKTLKSVKSKTPIAAETVVYRNLAKPNKVFNTDRKIYTVQDAADYILDYVVHCSLLKEVDEGRKKSGHYKNKLGDLHVYMDGSGRPMQFIT